MSKIIAVVPVRGGSQRVQNKNTRPFADTTLLDLKLQVLSGVSGLNDILVTTDCDICSSIARKHGVSLHRRDSFHAGSSVTNDQHWRHIAELTPGDIVFMTQVTSPLVRRSTHTNALKDYMESRDRFDSLNSVTLERKFLWKNMAPLNYDVTRTPKSQDLPEIFSLNFAITIIDRETMIRRGNVVGDRPRFAELDKIESIDIDDSVDFKVAESLYIDFGNKFLLDC